ncbi:MAG: hypothetical protein LBI45_09225 [Bacteroidales bacterium]|jgi:uncharacterized membrane protein|nr:hypothetical protein [Bacteroidales bacterium]
MKNRNIFTLFLDLLDVKYTKQFADKSYFEQPNNTNLYGLSKMFDLYNIPNEAFKADDKKEVLEKLPPPFVVHIDNNLGLLANINEENVKIILDGETINTSKERFLEYWSGIALIAEANEDSAEPNYKNNKREEVIKVLKKCGLVVTFLILLVAAYIKKESYQNIGVNLLLLANLFGIVISFLLLQKDLNILNRASDKLCTMLRSSNCNSKEFEKSASEIFGFKWSEIGFAYFTSNILLLLIMPTFIFYIALANLLSLPYTIWSILYQKFKIKQWCILCLFIQSALWAIFVINLIFGYIKFTTVIYYDAIIIIFSLYVLLCLFLNFLMPNIQIWFDGISTSQSYRRLKANDEVFDGLLKQSSEYIIPKQFSKVFFGNPNAEFFLTVITNPHCAPCAKAHKVLEHFLTKSEKIAVQYIFTSFDVSLDSSSEYLIGAYFADPDKAREIYSKWFEEGRLKREIFFLKHPLGTNKECKIEYMKHREWLMSTEFYETPTILVNGYLFPKDEYSLEELENFL